MQKAIIQLSTGKGYGKKSPVPCSTLMTEKEIMFKHLHLCLATNQRLSVMDPGTLSSCTNCMGNNEHTAIHLFYECEYMMLLSQWLLRILYNVCNFMPSSIIKFIYSIKIHPVIIIFITFWNSFLSWLSLLSNSYSLNLYQYL